MENSGMSTAKKIGIFALVILVVLSALAFYLAKTGAIEKMFKPSAKNISKYTQIYDNPDLLKDTNNYYLVKTMSSSTNINGKVSKKAKYILGYEVIYEIDSYEDNNEIKVQYELQVNKGKAMLLVKDCNSNITVISKETNNSSSNIVLPKGRSYLAIVGVEADYSIKATLLGSNFRYIGK